MKYAFTIWVCLSGHPQHCAFVYHDEMKGDYRECLDVAKQLIDAHTIASNRHAEYSCNAVGMDL